MGRHVSVQCDDTPASATTLLLRGQTRSVNDTPTLCYDISVMWVSMSLFSATVLLHCATAPLLRGMTRIYLVLYHTFRYLSCCIPLIHCYWSIVCLLLYRLKPLNLTPIHESYNFLVAMSNWTGVSLK